MLSCVIRARHYSRSFKNAIIEPEKVIAPTAAPIDISIKLFSLISPDNQD